MQGSLGYTDIYIWHLIILKVYFIKLANLKKKPHATILVKKTRIIFIHKESGITVT